MKLLLMVLWMLQICMLVMRQRSLKNIYTQQALLAVLPRLAAFNPTIFSTKSAILSVVSAP